VKPIMQQRCLCFAASAVESGAYRDGYRRFLRVRAKALEAVPIIAFIATGLKSR
jgi:hypothetical protein